jgi:hypothetical protein
MPGSEVRLEQTRPAVVLRIGETVISIDNAITDGILVIIDE